MFKSIILSLYNDTQENFKRLVTLVAPVVDNISSICRASGDHQLLAFIFSCSLFECDQNLSYNQFGVIHKKFKPP